MPAYALCETCEERCWENLHWIADHWRDLEEQLTAPEKPADGMPRGTRDAVGINLNGNVVDARRRITDTLRYWVQVILDENPGFDGPKDHPVAMARYLAKQHRRITRHHDAGVAAGLAIDAHDLRRLAFRYGFPSGARLFQPKPPIPCREEIEGEACPGEYQTWVTDRMDELPDLKCSWEPTHTLSPAEFRRVGRRTLDPEAVKTFIDAIGA